MSDPTGTEPGGRGGPEPAEPGSYGEPPPGYRLPAATRPGTVRLQVSDLARSVEFYERVLGLRVTERTGDAARLAAAGDVRGPTLLELRTRPGTRPAPAAGRFGLFHFAILLPDRAALGRFVRHLSLTGVRAGAGDHLVSEAFYLTDPDGLGIEVYADRPRESWRRLGRELMMATDPVDVEDVARAGGDVPWTGLPRGTRMGHLHLHVGDLAAAADFYSRGLGLDRMVWSYPGALFLAAGGYHHHLGVNTWAGRNARVPEEEQARLLEWTLELPTDAELAPLAASLRERGFSAREEDGAIVTADPWGTRLRVTLVGERQSSRAARATA